MENELSHKMKAYLQMTPTKVVNLFVPHDGFGKLMKALQYTHDMNAVTK